MGTREKRNLLNGLLFALPWIIGIVAFIAYPMLASLYYSFTKYNILKPPEWVGLANYKTMFADKLVGKSIRNVMIISAVVIPLQLVLGFITALLLDIKLKGQFLWRTLYFIPTIVPAVAVSFLYVWMLNPHFGLIYRGFEFIGIQLPNMINDPHWTKMGLLILIMWQIGMVTILYLASLQDIPGELYEAATIDGAGSWSKVTRITVPLVSHMTLFHIITGIIYFFKIFTEPYIISGANSPTVVSDPSMGYPENSLLFFSMYIYSNAFKLFNMGYASALAWVLFVITMIASAIVLWSSRRWTHYE